MYFFSHQFLTDMGLRLTGPKAMRLVLQPIVAILFGIKDGISDARAGEPPYIYDIIMVPADRKRELATGWAHIGKSLIFAVVLDAILLVSLVKLYQRKKWKKKIKRFFTKCKQKIWKNLD